MVPKGIQLVKASGGGKGKEGAKDGDEGTTDELGGRGNQEEMAVAVAEWEADEINWEVAMSAVMAEAEAIEPTFEEAKRWTDWLKWQEAI